MSAVVAIQPMIFFKNRKQAKAMQIGTAVTPITGFEKNPRVWYRGVGGFASSFAPTIAIQTAANGVFSNIWNPLLAATAAGIFSATIVCPAEGIMIQQQKAGKSFWNTAKHIHSSYGIQGFYRAFVSTAIREGTFTAAYLGATPLMKEKILSYEINEWAAQFIAGTVVGTIAAGISHPCDTFKTQKQSDFAMQTSMLRVIFQRAAFAGLGWRVGMVATATTIMSFVQEELNAKMNAAHY